MSPIRRAAAALRELAAAIESLGDAELASPPRSASDMVDLAELARRGIGRRVARTAITRGELPAVRVGRRYLCRLTDVDAWLAARAVAACPVTPATQRQPADDPIARALAGGRLRVVGGPR